MLVVVDQFTWVECYALADQTAERVARALVSEFIGRFGCPLELHSDQGRNFESRMFKEVCDLLKIVKTRTTPYRPSANGQVERMNRTIFADTPFLYPRTAGRLGSTSGHCRYGD